jgi:ubiquinone/menaquinone biosynthesis C-methylase UbiE
VGALGVPPGSKLLVIGVGSGLDLPHLPPDARGLGVDFSVGMLRRAARRRASLGMTGFELKKMDAQALDLPDGSFDAVYLPLIVTVAPDGARVLAEAARVARPGARVVVLDRFWPEGRTTPASVRLASGLLARAAMRPDLRFSAVHAGAPNLSVLGDAGGASGGFLRSVTLGKPG